MGKGNIKYWSNYEQKLTIENAHEKRAGIEGKSISRLGNWWYYFNLHFNEQIKKYPSPHEIGRKRWS